MPNLIHHRARKMRQTPSEAEKALWQHLNRKQFLELKFRRLVPIENYIVDFLCCPEKTPHHRTGRRPA